MTNSELRRGYLGARAADIIGAVGSGNLYAAPGSSCCFHRVTTSIVGAKCL